MKKTKKCQKHPRYEAKRKPAAPCARCWEIWEHSPNHFHKSYVCGVAWQHELGQTDVTLYPTEGSLNRAHNCTDSCGIVEVEVRLRRWVVEQDLRRDRRPPFECRDQDARGGQEGQAGAAEMTKREVLIRGCLDDFVSGRLTTNEFLLKYSPLSWNIHALQDPRLTSFVEEADLLIAEATGGHRTKESLLDGLRELVREC